ncbi:protein PXR1 [Blastomyces gilchristii SLH14081]|uniref:Protein PXR1 n=1 Tax=Blastomyces gilchristii (strain SLH14081) TaxID=559298 RepID=A0A179UE27_BLAGS|nr:protein PXR1 [Blastomyces gilchristii SLH14081]EQL38871.1 protein PXR1 [Blastomyces dermatitidis ATCC 26199]OAT05271.1 protein PXR1 [Blastomyces gilchristii SLH14081]
MGLAGPRKRTKIFHDPNNTAWSRSTSGYGHKIMCAQGWTPGSFLGASNAAHADHFTAGSAGHIRVNIKDDNLGLGARLRAEDEPTGLDAFQGLLGRLNGKSDAELEKEQKKRDDRRLASFIEQRWTTMRFVSGGLLVHEKIQALAEVKSVGEEKGQTSQSSQDEGKSEKTAAKKERKKDKRKVKSDDTGSDLAEESSKKKNKEKKEKKEKREKKEKKRKSRDVSVCIDTATTSEDALVDKKREKTKKRKQKEIEPSDTEAGDDAISPDVQTSAPQEEEKSSTAAKHGNIVKVREHRPMGRQFIRGRYIQQKKLALMDAKSLNEIFMVK